MGDFAQLLGRFFARDFLYLLGGANVLLASLLVFLGIDGAARAAGELSTLAVPLLVVGSGLMYVLGYFINYVFGLAKLNSPTDRLVPWDPSYPVRGPIVNALFKRLNGYDISELLQYIDKKVDISPLSRKDIRASHVYALEAISISHGYVDRTFTIHHLSSVFGSTFAVCALIFLIGALVLHSGLFLLASLATFIIGAIFCIDSHYRSSQIAIAHIMTSKWGIVDISGRPKPQEPPSSSEHA